VRNAARKPAVIHTWSAGAGIVAIRSKYCVVHAVSV
jgi:hypothetical protein